MHLTSWCGILPRYTNWSDVLTNHKSYYNNVQASVSGGNSNMQYLFGGGYNTQSTPFPTLHSGDGKDQKASVHFNLNTQSDNKKFKVSFTGNYVWNKNTVQSENFSTDRIYLAPDAPQIFNSDGSLNWEPLTPGQSGTWTNPYGALNASYNQNTSNLIGNAILSYNILPNWELKSSFGYNMIVTEEVQAYPTTVYDPGYNFTSGYSSFNTINKSNWIIEPQTTYKTNLFKGSLTGLLGGTFEGNNANIKTLNASGFVSDALIEDPQAAGSIGVASNSTEI